MIKTALRWVNPFLWGVVGWMVALFGNELVLVYGRRHPYLIHLDEAFAAIAFAFFRWLQGEIQVERIHHSREVERRLRGALQTLYHSTNEEHRRAAISEILRVMERERPVHPDFRESVEKLLRHNSN